MAFRSNTAAAPLSNARIPQEDKAIGYVNIYLPTASGKGKFVGVPIIPSRDGHQDLHDWLMEDLQNNVRKLLNQAIVDYTPIVKTDPGQKKFLLV